MEAFQRFLVGEHVKACLGWINVRCVEAERSDSSMSTTKRCFYNANLWVEPRRLHVQNRHGTAISVERFSTA